MKTIEINGRSFELHTCKHYNRSNSNEFRCAFRDLFDVYKKPSQRKINIYYDWTRWAIGQNFKNNAIESFGVYNGNCQAFTMRGLYIENPDDVNSRVFGLMVTRDHNKAYLLR